MLHYSPRPCPKPPLSSCERHGTTGATRVRFRATIAIVVATEIVGGGEGGPESVDIHIYICISIRFARFAFAENVYACVFVYLCACVCANASNADAAIAAKLQLTMYNVIVSHAMFRTPRLLTDSCRACRALRESFRVTEFVTKLLRFGSNLACSV